MPKKQERMYSIPEAARELKLSEAYIRLMIRNGIIESKPVPIRPGIMTTKHMVSQSELDLFNEREGKRTRRKDGRTKHCFYAHDDEMNRLKELLYSTHDDGLAIVAQSIDGGTQDEQYYVPPSKLESS